MTYLQLVNSVLRRLREDEVTTVAQTSYSKLIGEFVNDAKRTVEDSYDWTALRSTALTVSTTSDAAYNYTLTDSQNRLKILNVINQTSKRYYGVPWFYLDGLMHYLMVVPAPAGSPTVLQL